MSKIWFGVPLRNRSALGRETLICLKEQTASDFEALVLDNAPTEDIPQVFRDTVGEAPRFRYHPQEKLGRGMRNFDDDLTLEATDMFHVACR